MIGKVMMIAESAISERSIGKMAEEFPEKAGVLVKRIVNPDASGCFSPESMKTCGRKKLFQVPINAKKEIVAAKVLEIGRATLKKTRQ